MVLRCNFQMFPETKFEKRTKFANPNIEPSVGGGRVRERDRSLGSLGENAGVSSRGRVRLRRRPVAAIAKKI